MKCPLDPVGKGPEEHNRSRTIPQALLQKHRVDLRHQWPSKTTRQQRILHPVASRASVSLSKQKLFVYSFNMLTFCNFILLTTSSE